MKACSSLQIDPSSYFMRHQSDQKENQSQLLCHLTVSDLMQHQIQTMARNFSTQRVQGCIILRPPLHAPVTTDLYDTGYHDGQYFKN